jgi:hypothetical protein
LSIKLCAWLLIIAENELGEERQQLSPTSDGGHINSPIRVVAAHLDQTGINAVGLYSLYELFPSLGQNHGCDVYFTDNAVIIAHAPASIAPPSTANGRLSVAYTQLNTTRKENVVAQEIFSNRSITHAAVFFFQVT